MKKYYVYYLYYEDGTLADVGRSKFPEWRKRTKQRKHGCVFNIEVTESMSFKSACVLELAELHRLRPPLARRYVSSPGTLGKKLPHSEAHIKAIVAGRVGYAHSEETRLKIGAANKGHQHSTATKTEMSRTRKGKKRSLASKERMSLAATKRWNDKRLLQSGYGHPWRLQGLDQTTQDVIG